MREISRALISDMVECIERSLVYEPTATPVIFIAHGTIQLSLGTFGYTSASLNDGSGVVLVDTETIMEILKNDSTKVNMIMKRANIALGVMI